MPSDGTIGCPHSVDYLTFNGQAKLRQTRTLHESNLCGKSDAKPNDCVDLLGFIGHDHFDVDRPGMLHVCVADALLCFVLVLKRAI